MIYTSNQTINVGYKSLPSLCETLFITKLKHIWRDKMPPYHCNMIKCVSTFSINHYHNSNTIDESAYCKCMVIVACIYSYWLCSSFN